MKEFWNERYSEEGWAYGSKPNEFIKQQIDLLNKKGLKILFPAEGEGRNAVYAASQGHEVTAFDISESGRQKAELLANSKGVTMIYDVCGYDETTYPDESFDAVIFCYNHFPKRIQKSFFENMLNKLKPGGTILFECFSVNNLPYREKNPQVGGPDNADMLYNLESVQEYFMNCSVSIKEVVTQLNEGKYHVGEACVIRVIGSKN